MFREMIKSKQALGQMEIDQVMNRGTCGVLGVIGDEGYPYTVPMSYFMRDGAIYMHCARCGHKIDAILANPKVSFTVIDADDLVPEEFTTYYRSVIAFGTATLVEDELERYNAFIGLCRKLSASMPEKEMVAAYRQFGSQAHIIKIDVAHITGKQHQKLADRPPNQFIWYDVDPNSLTLAF